MFITDSEYFTNGKISQLILLFPYYSAEKLRSLLAMKLQGRKVLKKMRKRFFQE